MNGSVWFVSTVIILDFFSATDLPRAFRKLGDFHSMEVLLGCYFWPWFFHRAYIHTTFLTWPCFFLDPVVHGVACCCFFQLIILGRFGIHSIIVFISWWCVFLGGDLLSTWCFSVFFVCFSRWFSGVFSLAQPGLPADKSARWPNWLSKGSRCENKSVKIFNDVLVADSFFHGRKKIPVVWQPFDIYSKKFTSWGKGSLSHNLLDFVHLRWLAGFSSITSITWSLMEVLFLSKCNVEGIAKDRNMFRCLPLDPIVYRRFLRRIPRAHHANSKRLNKLLSDARGFQRQGLLLYLMPPNPLAVVFLNQGSKRNPNRNYLTWNNGIIRNG